MILQKSRSSYALIAIAIGGWALSLLLASSSQSAPTAGGRAKPKELQEIRKRIAETKAELDRNLGEERSLLGKLEKLNREISKKRVAIRANESEISGTQRDIGLKREEIMRIEDQLTEAQKRFQSAVRVHHRMGRTGWAKVLLSSRNVDEITRKAVMGRRISEYVLSSMQEPQRIARELKAEESALETSRSDLKRSKARLMIETQDIEATRVDQSEFLTSIRQDRQTRQQALDEMREAEAAMRGLLGELISGSELHTDFEAQKGVLPWPVKGRITKRYGRRIDPTYFTETFNKGIEIGPTQSEAAEVIAAHEGVVIFADWFRGYGRMTVLDHGDGYYTVYAHLENLNLELGDPVAWGQPVGTAGRSGLADEPVLYFELRKEGQPENPIRWLEPRR